MRNWLAKFQPTPWLFKKLVILAMLVSVGVSAFFWGRSQNAEATPPRGRPGYDGPVTPTSGQSEAARRVVAYLYGKPVSREELGEYLIIRFGVERLEFMLNRKIVETEAASHNIYVTDAEVNVRFERDLKAFGPNMTEKDFVNGVLRRFNKTLFEWKEDVIRPKLMMEKIVRPKVEKALTDKDLLEGYEARYGPKVECRMLVLDRTDRTAEKVAAEARKSREAFIAAAEKQAIPNLAANKGVVPPIHKHFGDANLEDTAFRLKVGEISGLIQMKDLTYVVLLCEKHIPADATKKFEDERVKMHQEMVELRLMQRIPEEFNEMKKRADPRNMLTPGPERTAMIQQQEPISLVQESSGSSGSGVVPAVSTVKVPPAPVPGKVEPMKMPAPPMPAPGAMPQLPGTPPPAPKVAPPPPGLISQSQPSTPAVPMPTVVAPPDKK